MVQRNVIRYSTAFCFAAYHGIMFEYMLRLGLVEIYQNFNGEGEHSAIEVLLSKEVCLSRRLVRETANQKSVTGGMKVEGYHG